MKAEQNPTIEGAVARVELTVLVDGEPTIYDLPMDPDEGAEFCRRVNGERLNDRPCAKRFHMSEKCPGGPHLHEDGITRLVEQRDRALAEKNEAVLDALEEVRHRIELQVERTKHTSHVDGLGMGDSRVEAGLGSALVEIDAVAAKYRGGSDE